MNLEFEQRSGHAVSRYGSAFVVAIERPEKANALDLDTCYAMSETFDEFAQDDSCIVGVLLGHGRHFCAGMDLGLVSPGERVVLPETGFGGLTARWLDKPMIAAVHGAVFGGGLELALACDLIVADATARFCLPEPRIGQAALAGGLERLPQRIGQARALDMILASREISAELAEAWGLVTRLCSDNQALSIAISLSGEISHAAPLSLKASKTVVRAHEYNLHSGIKQQQIDVMLDSQDGLEGAQAFKEKRLPVWSGR
jgi:crotonobetainyl-CoA hydratase